MPNNHPNNGLISRDAHFSMPGSPCTAEDVLRDKFATPKTTIEDHLAEYHTMLLKNQPKSFKSKPIKYVIMDEISQYPPMPSIQSIRNKIMQNENQDDCKAESTTTIKPTTISEEKFFTVQFKGTTYKAKVANNEASINNYSSGGSCHTQRSLSADLAYFQEKQEKLEAEIESKKELIDLLGKIEATARGEVTIS